MSSRLRLITGTAHPALANAICDHLGAPLASATVSTFPDGETMVKVNENIRGRDVYIIQPTSPPTNNNLMELLIMVDAVRRASAERITAVMPFFGYARQDRKDQPRVPITAKLVANLLVAAGVHRVLTMDLHAGQIQGFFDIPVDHLYATPAIIPYINAKKLENLVVVSPDVGGLKMAHAYARQLDTEFAIVAKHRVSATQVQALNVIGDVAGKNVLLVDDMTETAGTLTAAADLLKQHGADRILACVSHAVLSNLALQRLADSSIEELICTDSVPMARGHKVTAVTIAPLIAEAIRRIHDEESVTSLFDIKPES
jgi:ribose-phosphate pyrophosphokinase